MAPMKLEALVATANTVASTSSRSAKVAALADFLRKLEADEISPAVGFLSGSPMQGKIGVGWSRLASVDVPPAKRATLSILDLDKALTAILGTTGPRSASARSILLSDLLGRATAQEADFIRRLFVGELRQGSLQGLMTDAVARAAGISIGQIRRAMMLSGDLRETARVALTEGDRGLTMIGLEVLRPIQPMLASTAEDLSDAMKGDALVSVEWKLDGIRIQVHRDGRNTRVFTRNLNDITERVSEVVEVASSIPAKAFVLDGEAIGLSEDEAPHAFQETMSRIGRGQGEAEMVISPWFFDCLHLNGRDLLDDPLTTRLDALELIASRWKVPSVLTQSQDVAQEMLDSALEAGHEGVMVKSADSMYQAGRQGKAWRKVKIAKSLDLVVLGAEWGHGRRRGWLSNLHLGARDEDGGFVMVGKTFKGLTDETLRWQTERFLELETVREGITVFVRPELVVEIELDGVLVSPRYAGGVALRFARVKRYRPDKSPADADSIEAVRGLL